MSHRTDNLVGALALALGDGINEVLAESSGLRLPDAAVLNVVGQFPGGTIESARVALGITHGGVVRVVDRLSAAGQIERRPGPDGRSLALHLTPAGLATWQALSGARSAWLRDVTSRLPRDARQHVDAVVSALLAALTPDEDVAERTCRLCDVSVCPQRRCPVTLAAEASA